MRYMPHDGYLVYVAMQLVYADKNCTTKSS